MMINIRYRYFDYLINSCIQYHHNNILVSPLVLSLKLMVFETGIIVRCMIYLRYALLYRSMLFVKENRKNHYNKGNGYIHCLISLGCITCKRTETKKKNFTMVFVLTRDVSILSER